MLKFKGGVDPYNASGEIVLAIQIAADIYAQYGYDCVITSLYDGKHGANTLHQRDGRCRAVDLRINNLPDELVKPIYTDIRLALPHHYDVVHEKDHFHLEYDRKEAKV
jgi:hypothetical protein